MAPSRPAVYPEQFGLLLFSVIVIVAGIWAVFRFLL
jgi:hypothetical protein